MSLRGEVNDSEALTEELLADEKQSPDQASRQCLKSSRARERCRQTARRLAARGEVFITQGGKAVDPSFAKGTMELKLPI